MTMRRREWWKGLDRVEDPRGRKWHREQAALWLHHRQQREEFIGNILRRTGRYLVPVCGHFYENGYNLDRDKIAALSDEDADRCMPIEGRPLGGFYFADHTADPLWRALVRAGLAPRDLAAE
jgi:hypothetical protein